MVKKKVRYINISFITSYMAEAGSTMLIFSMASWVIIQGCNSDSDIYLVHISINKTSFEHYCLICSYIVQNKNKMGSGCPPSSGQIPPTSGSSDYSTRY